jgi:hypothetical protein
MATEDGERRAEWRIKEKNHVRQMDQVLRRHARDITGEATLGIVNRGGRKMIRARK